jgi:hypothetical protein
MLRTLPRDVCRSYFVTADSPARFDVFRKFLLFPEVPAYDQINYATR